MALIASNGTGGGNWSAGASWTGGVKPGTGDTVDILAGDTIVLDESTATLGAAGIINHAGANNCQITVGGTFTINGPVSYSGTSTSGFIQVGTSGNLTVLGKVTSSGSGYAIKTSNDGILIITVGSGDAILSSSTGWGLSSTGTGKVEITGDISHTTGATGYGAVIASTSAQHIWTGNAVNSAGSNAAYYMSAGTMTWTPATGTSSTVSGSALKGAWVGGGTLTIAGNLSTSEASSDAGLAAAIAVSGTGAANYTGSRTLAANTECNMTMYAGTINLVLQSGAYTALTLANSGTFVIRRLGGTLNLTGNSGASVAYVTNQTATSYAAILGTIATGTRSASIVGPTLPAAGDVDSTAADYGYAGSLTEPTCVLPAEADVETGVQYGAGGTEFEGTLAAGGGVWMPRARQVGV